MIDWAVTQMWFIFNDQLPHFLLCPSCTACGIHFFIKPIIFLCPRLTIHPYCCFFVQELCVLSFAEKCCTICLLEYMLLRKTSGLGQRGLEMMPVHTYLTITRLITEEVKDLKHLSQQVNRKTASFALQKLRPTDKAIPNSECGD